MDKGKKAEPSIEEDICQQIFHSMEDIQSVAKGIES
jgi:hypothetical protein